VPVRRPPAAAGARSTWGRACRQIASLCADEWRRVQSPAAEVNSIGNTARRSRCWVAIIGNARGCWLMLDKELKILGAAATG